MPNVEGTVHQLDPVNRQEKGCIMEEYLCRMEVEVVRFLGHWAAEDAEEKRLPLARRSSTSQGHAGD